MFLKVPAGLREVQFGYFSNFSSLFGDSFRLNFSPFAYIFVHIFPFLDSKHRMAVAFVIDCDDIRFEFIYSAQRSIEVLFADIGRNRQSDGLKGIDISVLDKRRVLLILDGLFRRFGGSRGYLPAGIIEGHHESGLEILEKIFSIDGFKFTGVGDLIFSVDIEVGRHLIMRKIAIFLVISA